MKKLLCRNCGYEGSAKTMTKGSIFIEMILYFCFIIPGLIYSMWRVINRYKVCPKCRTPNMIPLDSPMALLYQSRQLNESSGRCCGDRIFEDSVHIN
ncbi:MAG: hypothetical protein JSW07_18080 [bacterium]|nr:MAG: hypothetical protein JSW07_18080 [bacterium]